MQIRFAFGKVGLSVELPQEFDYHVLEARSATPLEQPLEALQTAMLRPVAGPALRDLAQGKRTAAISVCDITRPAPNRFVLPPLLQALEEAGIHRQNVSILIATGLHRPATELEIIEILGPEIAATVPVFNHNAKALNEHRYLGQTNSGTPVYIDERFVAADVHITLGFIEPHLMLGFSGGRKLVAPGLAAQETIKVLHSPKFMRDKRTIEGSVADNPLHAELLEIARMAGQHFIVDVALTRDRQIAGVFAGAAEAAHKAGMSFVSRVMLETIDEPVDAVITSAAGYPLDLTFYQAVKGITAAQHILKPGGRILAIAECAEGAGAPEFCEMLRIAKTGGAYLDRIKDTPVVVDQWQLEKLALVAEKASLHFYTPGLPAAFKESLWGELHQNVTAAVKAVTFGLPKGARIALMPEGPYVLAKVGQPVLA